MLDKNEFSKGCRDFGAKLSKEEVDEIFTLIDKDGSGEIDFDEFLVALRVIFDCSCVFDDNMDVFKKLFSRQWADVG